MEAACMPGGIIFLYVLINDRLMAARAKQTVLMPRFIIKDHEMTRLKRPATPVTNKTTRMPVFLHGMDSMFTYRFLASMTYSHIEPANPDISSVHLNPLILSRVGGSRVDPCHQIRMRCAWRVFSGFQTQLAPPLPLCPFAPLFIKKPLIASGASKWW